MKSIVMARAGQGMSFVKTRPITVIFPFLVFPNGCTTVCPSSRYCIWNKDGDGSPSQLGSCFETRALINVLHERRATNKGLKADVDFVFVHAGAIKTLNQLPALMERLDIQFVAYGTHHTIPPAQWGIRQIYPAGKHR